MNIVALIFSLCFLLPILSSGQKITLSDRYLTISVSYSTANDSIYLHEVITNRSSAILFVPMELGFIPAESSLSRYQKYSIIECGTNYLSFDNQHYMKFLVELKENDSIHYEGLAFCPSSINKLKLGFDYLNPSKFDKKIRKKIMNSIKIKTYNSFLQRNVFTIDNSLYLKCSDILHVTTE